MRADFLHHTACPSCRARGEDSAGDNLGVYKDGHKHCFKCGHHESGGESLSITGISEQLLKEEDSPDGMATLPADFTFDLPPQVIEWLQKYGITPAEVKQHSFGWSPRHESLVFPVFDKYGNLAMAQSRRFGTKHKGRYHTSGLLEAVFHLVGKEQDSVVLVEDIISAVKVGRVTAAMPLWGSSISNHRLWVLSQRLTSLVIWLDSDKANYAMRRQVQARLFFDSVRVIITELDPKCYSEQEIKEILYGNSNTAV